MNQIVQKESNKIILINNHLARIMKPNFDISLPSIPGKNIKFKIQDIKQTSFGSRKQRFSDNKRGLTKKFIESFNNFHETKEDSQSQQQTQASQTNSRISVKSNSFHGQNERKFRHMIPQDRKHIISVYEKYREYEQPLINQNKFDKGYTFHKAAKQIVSIKDEPFEHQNDNSQWTKKFVTDNYYFTSNLIPAINTGENKADNPQSQQDYPKKKQKQSAVFKNQPRQLAWNRDYKNDVPGPGFYLKGKETQKKTKQSKTQCQKQSQAKNENDYKKLKQLISSIVGQSKEEEDGQAQTQNKKQMLQHMFVKDDRDRFGQQKYPISSKVNVPGPGSYETMRGIEDQARRVMLVEEQRKLLKQWFNN